MFGVFSIRSSQARRFTAWHLVGAFFLLNTIFAPALVSAQSSTAQVAASQFATSQFATSQAPSSLTVAAHVQPKQGHHRGVFSAKPVNPPSEYHCMDADCDMASGCADACDIGSCCSSPVVFNIHTHSIHTLYINQTSVRSTEGQIPIARSLVPLLRPPIY